MAATLRVNNVGSLLSFRVLTQSGTAKNITGGTVTLGIRRPDPDNRVLQKSGSLTDPSNGIFTYTTIAGDLSVPGVYVFNAKVVLSGTTLYTDEIQAEVFQNAFV